MVDRPIWVTPDVSFQSLPPRFDLRGVTWTLRGYHRTVEARTVSRDVVTSRDHPGVLRTGATMFVFVAVIVGSWALVIGGVWLLLRLLT